MNRLRSLLAGYYPAALTAFGDLTTRTALVVPAAAPTPARLDIEAQAADTDSVIACPVDYSENLRLTATLGELTGPFAGQQPAWARCSCTRGTRPA